MNSYFTSQKAGFGVRLIRGLAALALAITSLAVVFHLTGCEQTPTEVQDYHPEPILSGFIVNGEPVTEVYLERVAGLGSYYDPRDHGIVGAEIILYEVGGSDSLRFTDDPAYPGRYVPTMGDSLVPRGTALYRIEAQTPTPANELLWGETRVPGAVDGHVQTFVVNPDSSVTPVLEGDTLTRDFGTFVWVWSDVDSVGGFQGLGRCLTPRDSLVPLDPDWDPAEDSLKDADRERAGWMVMRDDQRSITIPWAIFTWVGWHELELLAISREYWEYLFAIERRNQGLDNSAGSNIHGGLGIFGAFSKHRTRIFMQKVRL